MKPNTFLNATQENYIFLDTTMRYLEPYQRRAYKDMVGIARADTVGTELAQRLIRKGWVNL